MTFAGLCWLDSAVLKYISDNHRGRWSLTSEASPHASASYTANRVIARLIDVLADTSNAPGIDASRFRSRDRAPDRNADNLPGLLFAALDG
jgi:hypothetical protein